MKEVLIKHKELADLVLNHGYLPNGSAGVVHELNTIYMSLGHRKVDNFCPACIKEMFSILYNIHLPRLIAEETVNTVIPTIVEPKKRGRKASK